MYTKKIGSILLLIKFIGLITFIISDLCAAGKNIDIEIDSLITLNKENPNQGYSNKAFTKLEIKKNRAIQKVLFDCLPDDSLKNLIARYNYLYAKKTALEDSSKYYIDKIDSLKKQVIRDYPQYAYFMLAHNPVTVKEVQQKYLREKQALLNFSVSENRIHVFFITKDTFQVVSYHINRDELSQKLVELLAPIYRAKNPLYLNFDLKLAHQLYNQIFAPVEKLFGNEESIIIIPDDIFLGFPFECLVAQLNFEQNDNKTILYEEYAAATFLIHKYAVSYNFSTLALNPKFQAIHSHKKLGRKLLTVSELTGLEHENDTTGIGWNLQSPAYGKEQVTRVSRLLWRHKNLTEEEATEDYLKNNCFDFRWIYLAIPGMLNNETPNLSALMFSSSFSSLQDNRLYISEVINCNLRADLITLSGCELKPFQVEKKLGVIGIPQSFLLSGVQSVMFSLWRIHDETICRFMSKFYWELKYKRQTNSLALQQAKLSSIDDTFKYKGREISKAHPYFWAPYILIGNVNVRPPTFSTIPPRMVILIMYVIVLTVSMIIVRKTVDKNSKK